MQSLSRLLDALQRADIKDTVEKKEGEEFIKVHLMTSAVAFAYEKLRTFVDYKEEHLLRKNAIYRIVRRRFFDGGNFEKKSENLIKELISARYLPNNAIPESRIQEVAQIIEKYDQLFTEVKEFHGLNKSVKMYEWIIGLAAVEIENQLTPTNKEQVLMQFLFHELHKRIGIMDEGISDDEKELLLYIATNRSLIRSDRQMLDYLVLRLWYPQWITSPEQFVRSFARDIFEIKQSIARPVEHYLSYKLLKAAQPYATKVRILREVILEDLDAAGSVLATRHALEEKIKDICSLKYKEVRTKVSRSVVRAIIYILITKVAVALLLEVPLDYWFYDKVDVTAIAVNITFPPFLMFLIALSLRTPSKKNTEAMVSGIVDLLEGRVEEMQYVRPPKKRRFITRFIFDIIYLLSFLIPFVITIYILWKIHFSVFSIVLFLFFMSIVSFFGVRIKQTAQELVVLRRKENLIGELFDFFTVPVVRLGRWLSLNFSKVNIFVFVMDIIIEAPLKILLQVFEEWMGFMREKKDDIG